MGLLDFLTRFQDKYKQSSAISDFKEKHTQFKDVPDDKLAPALAEKYPDKYGFLSSYDPGAVVPAPKVPNEKRSAGFYEKHTDIAPQKEALNTVSLVKEKYPQFADVEDTKLAKALETKYPDRFKGISEKALTEKHGFIGIDTTPKKDKGFKDQALEFLGFSPTPADKMSDADATVTLAKMTGLDPHAVSTMSQTERLKLVREYGGLSPDPSRPEFYRKLLGMSAVMFGGVNPKDLLVGVMKFQAVHTAISEGIKAYKGERLLTPETGIKDAWGLLDDRDISDLAGPNATAQDRELLELLQFGAEIGIAGQMNKAALKRLKETVKGAGKAAVESAKAAGEVAGELGKSAVEGAKAGVEAVKTAPQRTKDALMAFAEGRAEYAQTKAELSREAGPLVKKLVAKGMSKADAAKQVNGLMNEVLNGVKSGEVTPDYAMERLFAGQVKRPAIVEAAKTGAAKTPAETKLAKELEGFTTPEREFLLEGKIAPKEYARQRVAGKSLAQIKADVAKIGKGAAEVAGAGSAEAKEAAIQAYSEQAKKKIEDFKKEGEAETNAGALVEEYEKGHREKSIHGLKYWIETKSYAPDSEIDDETQKAVIAEYKRKHPEEIKEKPEEITDIHPENIANASSEQLKELIETPGGHPDEQGFNVPRAELIEEMNKRGEQLLKDIKYPTNPDAVYRNKYTGHEKTYKDLLESETNKTGTSWFAIPEHWLPAEGKNTIRIDYLTGKRDAARRRYKSEKGSEKARAKQEILEAEKELKELGAVEGPEEVAPEKPEGIEPKSIKKVSDKFYVSSHFDKPKTFTEVKGAKAIKIGDVEAFTYQTARGKNASWAVVEATTGHKIGMGKTQVEAVEVALKQVKEHSGKMDQLRKEAIARSGLSPRYGESKETREKEVTIANKEYNLEQRKRELEYAKQDKDQERIDYWTKQIQEAEKGELSARDKEKAKEKRIKDFKKKLAELSPEKQAEINKRMADAVGDNDAFYPIVDEVLGRKDTKDIFVESKAEPDAQKIEELAEKYVKMLKQTETKDFHRNFIKSIFNKDLKGVLGLVGYAWGWNDNAKKMFQEITGVKLPRTKKGIIETVTAWAKGKAEETTPEVELLRGAVKESESVDDFEERMNGYSNREIVDIFLDETRAENQTTENLQYELETWGIDDDRHSAIKALFRKTKSKTPTQKEKVAEAVKEEAKPIKQIAEETGILEPNVRRILGEGAKEGVFARVDKGVYILKVNGKDIAYIHTGDAVETLPRLAEEGFKADMVFLDIPYKTAAITGGNRGMKYNLISTDEFKVCLDAVKKIVRTDNSAVFYMFSQAKSGVKDMAKYTDELLNAGLKPIARGNYTKYQQDGITRVRNMRGDVIEPEGIVLLSLSGQLDKEAPIDLDFHYVRPRGYQSEKPADMLQKMIEMTTEEGDTVLDPFAGSGVTIAEAVKAGRTGVGIEKEPEVVEKVIKPRVKQAAEERAEISPATIEKAIKAYKDEVGRLEQAQEQAINVLRETGYHIEEDKGADTLADAYTIQKDGKNLEYDELPEEGKRFINLTRQIDEDNDKINRLEAGEELSAIEMSILRKVDQERWQYGAEPAAAIPGEAMAFLDADENLENPKAVIFQTDEGAYVGKIIEKDAFVVNTKTERTSILFEGLQEAQRATQETLDTDLPTVEDKGQLVEQGSEARARGLKEYLSDNNKGDILDTGGEEDEQELEFQDGAGQVEIRPEESRGEVSGAGEETPGDRRTARLRADHKRPRGSNPVRVAESSDEEIRENVKLTLDRPIELTISERRALNKHAEEILTKSVDQITDSDREILRQYTGLGGLQAAEEGVLNQHYTSYEIVKFMWDKLAKLGVKIEGAEALEAAGGVGNFVGFKPDGVKFDVVEMDETASKVASILYPNERHFNMPFEKFVDGRLYDISIGNDPFGNFRGDVRYAEEAKDYAHIGQIHDFFLVKRLDLLKPNGILAVIVSTGTMDKSDQKNRVEINKRAVFLGGYRLPNGIFKKNTHYEGTVDVLFFRKRVPEEIKSGAKHLQPEFIETEQIDLKNTKGEDRVLYVSKYFKDNPGQMWGKPFITGQYGSQIGVKATKPVSEYVSKAIADEMKFEPARSKYTAEQGGFREMGEAVAEGITAPVGAIVYKDGQFLEVGSGGRAYKTDLKIAKGGIVSEKMIRAIDMIDKAERLVTGLRETGKIDKKLQSNLKKHVTDYWKKYKRAVGYDVAISAKLRQDPRYFKLAGLMDKDGDIATILTVEELPMGKRVVEPFKQGSLKDAVRYIKETQNSYAPDKIAALLGEDQKSVEERLVKELGWNVDGDTVAPDEVYLFGDILPKIETAERLGLEKQAAKLRAVLPEQGTIETVKPSLLYNWTPDSVRDAWLEDIGIGGHLVRKKNPSTGILEWAIEDGNTWEGPKELKINDNYPSETILKYLNHEKEYDKIGYGEDAVKVYNPEKTKALRIVDDLFHAWLKKNPAHAEKAIDKYNRAYRSYRHRAMDNTPYEMEGISETFKGKNLKVKSHQWEWTSLAMDMGKSINAHGVGGGKTMAAILMGQLAGQLGTAKRKMLCVPAKVMRKWAFEIQELFPTAKVISLENLSQNNAYRTLQQVAMNDFDFAIISTDRLKMIPIKMADEFLREDISEMEQRIRDNKESRDRAKKQTERKLQEQLLKLKEKLAGLQQMKRTNTIFWEDLNIEMLVVDEAHNYKNVWVDYGTYKNDQSIAAENNSERANDLWYKTRAMREKGAGYIHFLTATPTTNKPIEIYSMLRFLAPDEWTQRGIQNAGDFIDQFCEIDDIQIPDVTGLMTSKRVIVGYKNLRDLRGIFRKYVDFRSFEDMAEVERPDAKYVVKEVPMSTTQKRIAAKIVAEMNFAKQNPKEAKDKGISLLALTTQSRQSSVGADIWDGFKYEKWTDPNSKKEHLVNNIISLYREHKGSGQLIFLDLFQGRKPLTPEEKAYLKMEGAPAKAIDRPVYVNYHEQIRKMLIDKGIPADTIAIVNGAVNNTPGKKQKVADDYETGKLRILIGTTKSMGEGMDLQADTVAIHNVDVPWTPAELTQRNGRGVRQGNKQDLVHVFNYVTKGSLDAFMYGKLARKDKWNKELWTSDKDFMSNDMNLDEESGLSYEELSQSLTIDETELAYWNNIYASEMKNDELARLDKELATLNNRVSNIRNDIADRQKKIGDYETDIQSQSAEGKDVTYLEARIEGHKEKISESEKMLEDFVKELGVKTAERKAVYDQLQALRQVISARGEDELLDDVALAEDEPGTVIGRKEQETIEKLEAEKPPIIEGVLGEQKGFVYVPGRSEAKEALGRLGEMIMAPVNAAMDFLWKFNKQKRLDPELAEALLRTTAELNTRVERGIAEVNKVIQGRKLTKKDRALLLFAVEEKSFKGIPKELEPVRDIFVKMFEDIDKVNRERNIYRQSFLERVETEVSGKIMVTKEKMRGYLEAAKTGNNRGYCNRMAKKKMAELEVLKEQLKQIQDLRYVTHRGVVQAILDRKMSEFKDKKQRQVWLSQARRISFKYKHRKGITPLREFYMDGLLKLEDVDIVRVAMMITSEAQFRWAMKDLFDFAKAHELILPARKKGIPSNWNAINPIRYGLVAPEYTNYRVHPLFEEGLLEIKRGFTRSRNPVKTLFSIIKTAQFYQPFIIWKYDMLQMSLGGAFSINPKKQGAYFVKAFTSVLRAKTLQVHDELYDEALRHNIFQKAYLPSIGSKSEAEAINMAVKRTIADYPFILKVIEGVVDMPLTSKDAINIIKIIYRTIGNVTWLGDEILRLTGYVAYKEMGYSAKDAAYFTSQWFGAYDDIAAGARDKFSYIFFVYAFRILMPRQIFRLIYEPVKMTLDTIASGGGKLLGKPGEYGKTYKKRDWERVIKGLAALFFITLMVDAHMRKKGFYRKIFLYKWAKKVTDNLGREKEMVVALNLIYNQPMKWASRLAYYDPTLKWPRPFQGLYKYAQWELHPFYRIVFYDIARNQKSIGFGQIFNPNLQGPEGNLKKFGQIMSYFTTESISLLRLARESSDVTEQYVLDEQEKQALWDKTLNGLEQAVVGALGHKYITKNPEEYYDSAIFRLKQEFRKRKRWVKTAEEAAELEKWVYHCEDYFGKMFKRQKEEGLK